MLVDHLQQVRLDRRGPIVTLLEMNLAVFDGRKCHLVFFQPRLESWFFRHRTFKSLPVQYRDRSVRDVYDDLGVSNRYFSHFTGLAEPVEICYNQAVKISTKTVGGRKTTVIETPYGPLIEERRMTVDNVWRKTGFAVRTAEDLVKLEWLFKNATMQFNAEAFERGRDFQGNRGHPQFWILPSPYETLTQEWMSFEDFPYALVDVPARMEQVMNAIDPCYDQMFGQIIAHGGVKIVNFPENIHVARTPPDWLERYLIPWYEKRSNQLRAKSIYTHIHIDGDFKPLLKYMKSLPFDGLEALTPLPQGDVTLEEIEEHIGDKVLLDGIPAVLFLNHYSRDQLQQCVEEIVARFHPRLVLGISDELPQGAGQEVLDRVRWIAEYCRTCRPGRPDGSGHGKGSPLR